MEFLTDHRLIPVVVIDDVASASPLAQALVDGGLPIAEVTLRTPNALNCLAEMAKNTQVLVGAGTVLKVDQVDEAVAAGARFIVSPGLSASIAERCTALDVPYLPGASTATEIQAALDLGITTVKFFPAEASGGAKAVKALSAPFGGVRFVPTGGVNSDNVGSYLSLPQVDAVGGSWMIDTQALADGRCDDVTAQIARAVAALGNSDESRSHRLGEGTR